MTCHLQAFRREQTVNATTFCQASTQTPLTTTAIVYISHPHVLMLKLKSLQCGYRVSIAGLSISTGRELVDAQLADPGFSRTTSLDAVRGFTGKP
jgi:hypothetical protein